MKPLKHLYIYFQDGQRLALRFPKQLEDPAAVARALRKQTISRATFIMFSWLQVFTACAFAFSHGANDIANAIGPFVAVLDVLKTGQIGAEAAVPTAALIAFGVALVSGLWFVGRKVIHTVGTGLTAMHPSSGFAAELAAATIVLLASVLGLPVSSTHILIGAVLGVSESRVCQIHGQAVVRLRGRLTAFELADTGIGDDD